MRQIQIPWEKNACGIRDVAAGMKYKRIQIQKKSEEEKSITNVAAAGFDQSNASFHTGHTRHSAVSPSITAECLGVVPNIPSVQPSEATT